jgi:hypothetical protein
VRYSEDSIAASTAWVRDLDAWLPQFKFTPWVEIPDVARELIVPQREKISKEARAKWAIEKGVPVSSVSNTCKPEHPDCHDISSPNNQDVLGGVYRTVLTKQVLRIIKATQALIESKQRLLEVTGASGSLAINRSLVEHIAIENALLKEHIDFLDLLPASAVLPELELPERAPQPASCRERAPHGRRREP